MMKFFVTGANGFVGRYLVNELLKKNHKVTCLIRKKEHSLNLEGSTFVIGDINDKQKIEAGICGQDIVYHLVGIGNVSAVSKKDYEVYKKINVMGTKTILDACLKYKVKKIVYLSSTAAMGLVKDEINEKTLCNPQTPYQKSKYEAEQLIHHYFKEYKLPIIILRPSMIYGPKMRHGQFIKMHNFLRKGFFPLINGGKSIIPFIYIKDLIQAILSATEFGKNGDVYIISSAEKKSLKTIVHIMQQKINPKARIFNLPKFLLIPPVFFIQSLASLLGLKPPMTLQRLNSITTSRIFDISKAKNELKWNPLTDLEEGLEKTLKWFKEI